MHIGIYIIYVWSLLQIVALCCFVYTQNTSTIHGKSNANIFSFICLSVTNIASWVRRYSTMSMYCIGYFIYLHVETGQCNPSNISKGILTRIARAFLAKILLKIILFTRIPIFSLTESCLGNLSSVDCIHRGQKYSHGDAMAGTPFINVISKNFSVSFFLTNSQQNTNVIANSFSEQTIF